MVKSECLETLHLLPIKWFPRFKNINPEKPEVKVLFYPSLPSLQDSITLQHVPRLRPFHLQLRAPCSLKWVWGIGGMILTGKTLSAGSQTCPIANLCTRHFTQTDLGSRFEAGYWPTVPWHGQPWLCKLTYIIHKNSVPTPARTESCSIMTDNHSMMFRETSDVFAKSLEIYKNNAWKNHRAYKCFSRWYAFSPLVFNGQGPRMNILY